MAANTILYPPEYTQQDKPKVIDVEYLQSLRSCFRISEAMLGASTFIAVTVIDTYTKRNWGEPWIQFVCIATIAVSVFHLFVYVTRCIKHLPAFIPVYEIEMIVSALFALFYAISIIIVTIEAHASSVLSLYACTFLCAIAMFVFLGDTYKTYKDWKSPNVPPPNPPKPKVVKKNHAAGPAVVNGLYPGGPWNPLYKNREEELIGKQGWNGTKGNQEYTRSHKGPSQPSETNPKMAHKSLRKWDASSKLDQTNSEQGETKQVQQQTDKKHGKTNIQQEGSSLPSGYTTSQRGETISTKSEKGQVGHQETESKREQINSMQGDTSSKLTDTYSSLDNTNSLSGETNQAFAGDGETYAQQRTNSTQSVSDSSLGAANSTQETNNKLKETHSSQEDTNSSQGETNSTEGETNANTNKLSPTRERQKAQAESDS